MEIVCEWKESEVILDMVRHPYSSAKHNQTQTYSLSFHPCNSIDCPTKHQHPPMLSLYVDFCGVNKVNL